MDATRVAELIRVYRDGLLEDVLPFWIENAVDRAIAHVVDSINVKFGRGGIRAPGRRLRLGHGEDPARRTVK